MVGGTPLSPPLGVGAVVGAEPVPVALADMAVGWARGAVGMVGTGMVGAVGTGFMWPVAIGNMVEVWWVVLELGSVGVLWEGLGGSALMAAVGWKLGCSGSEGSQYPRPKSLVTAIRALALVWKVPG